MTTQSNLNILTEKPVDAGVILIPVLFGSDWFEFVSDEVIETVDQASLIDEGVVFIPILGIDGKIGSDLISPGIIQEIDPASLIEDGVILVPILGVDGDMERPLGIMQSVESVADQFSFDDIFIA